MAIAVLCSLNGKSLGLKNIHNQSIHNIAERRRNVVCIYMGYLWDPMKYNFCRSPYYRPPSVPFLQEIGEWLPARKDIHDLTKMTLYLLFHLSLIYDGRSMKRLKMAGSLSSADSRFLLLYIFILHQCNFLYFSCVLWCSWQKKMQILCRRFFMERDKCGKGLKSVVWIPVIRLFPYP